MSWGSLKIRLALAVALLMSLGVAATVLRAVGDTRLRATQSILESNLGVSQVASGLSARLVERQRALRAAADGWPRGVAADSPRGTEYLRLQWALGTLFDRLEVVPADIAGSAADGLPYLVIPPRAGSHGEVTIEVPIPRELHGRRLAGTLRLDGDNFLSAARRPESVGQALLETFVADQQGRVIAHADPSRLLGRIDDEPALREAVAKWRSAGAPMEPAPWTEAFQDRFVAMAAVPGTDWMVFREAHADDLLGRASRSILRTMATGFAVALVGAVAIFAVTAWLLRPMSLLQRRALRALDPAQPPQAGWPQGRGEVGQLAEVLRHVSGELAASQARQEQSLRDMQAVLDHAPVGIVITAEGRFKLVSRELERMLGYPAGSLQGASWDQVLPDFSEALREAARTAAQQGRSFESELQLRCRDGSPLWAQLRSAVVPGEQASGHKVWIATNATNARHQREQLLWSATRDPLTELVNRREFEHRLRKLVAERRRHAPACALFIDLDHFKQVNDGAGHGAGDTLLKRVSQALAEHVRDDDVVARLGGDEFAVLLFGCELPEGLRIAELIRGEVHAHGQVEHVATRVTASIGVVEIDGSLPTLKAVLEAADRACYAAKRAGRDCVRSHPAVFAQYAHAG